MNDVRSQDHGYSWGTGRLAVMKEYQVGLWKAGDVWFLWSR